MSSFRRPRLSDLPAPQVRAFRDSLTQALGTVDPNDNHGRPIGSAKWGVYGFYDYDGEPIYVGQTNELLRTRVRRHLTNQRTDAVAMRILDVFEVAELELWPLWELQNISPTADKRAGGAAQDQLDATEYSAYLKALRESRFHAILNERIPPVSEEIKLPPSRRFTLISQLARQELGHPDVRIARRADTLHRLAAVAHERGEVSPGLRRVVVVQAIRLAYLSAARLAETQGWPPPDPGAIAAERLVGPVSQELANGNENGEEHAGEAEIEV